MIGIPIFFGFFVLGIGCIVIAIMTAVDASKYPDWAYQQIGSSKFVWQILPIVLLFLCGFAGGIMGLVWFSSKRQAVAAAAGRGGPPPYGYGAPPPGWGPPPGAGGWMPPSSPPPSAPPPPTPPPGPPL